MSASAFHPSIPAASQRPVLKVARTTTPQETGKEASVFSLSLGAESILLLPFRNWGQLDVHKWSVRGKLPATPAGLEITPEHVKVAGETVSVNDPEGCSKLEHVLNQWLTLEQGTLELARKRNQPKPPPIPSEVSCTTQEQPLQFRVELDHERHVHVKCVQGKETLAEIGLTLLGWNSLASQGLMRKPASLKVGALHDWLELDGDLYSFEKGRDDSARLEMVLNEKYLSSAALGRGKDIVVFTNAASSTGFDIQFSVLVGGAPDKRRRPLNEETLELLQDPQRCGVLRKGLVIKLTRPSIIFKQKTPDGGERYLEYCEENQVNVTADDGSQKTIDLSQPVNYLHLSAVELTAVFNHPAINQHSKLSPPGGPKPNLPIVAAPAKPEAPAQTAVLPPSPPPAPVTMTAVEVQPHAAQPAAEEVPSPPAPTIPEQQPLPAEAGPNEWLRDLLAMPQMRFHWFARLVYGQFAERFGNSHQGKLGPMDCWYVCIGEPKDIEDFEFHGVFLTEKGSLGFLNRGHLARFYKSVAFIGGQERALEGIDVNLTAAGLDHHQRVVFIVAEEFMDKFEVPEQTLAEELESLRTYGAVVLSHKQALESREPIQVVWAVPAEQENPEDPEAFEGTPLVPLETNS